MSCCASSELQNLIIIIKDLELHRIKSNITHTENNDDVLLCNGGKKAGCEGSEAQQLAVHGRQSGAVLLKYARKQG